MSIYWKINLVLFHSVNGFAGRPVVDMTITTLSQNNLLREIFLTSPYVFCWFRFPAAEQRARVIGGLIGGALAIGAARLLTHVLPFENRPMFDSTSGFRSLKASYLPDLVNWSAFPSDTAALCMALPLGLFALNRALALPLSVLTFVLFSLPRVYEGIHYPFDLLGGMAVGVAAAALANARPLRQVYGSQLDLMRKAEPWFYAIGFVVLAEVAELFDATREILRLIRRY